MSRANIRTSSTMCWTGRRTCWRRARCTRSSTAASTGTPASTATGCCCDAAAAVPGPARSAARSEALLDAMLTPEKVAGELAYLDRASTRRVRAALWLGLAAQAARRGAARTRTRLGATALAPLADAFAARFDGYPAQADLSDPRRHPFQHRLRADPRARLGGGERPGARRADPRPRARIGIGGDRDCQAWEPGGDEFLSPALIEALLHAPRAAAPRVPRLVRRLPAATSPRASRPPCSRPAIVTDRRDGKIAHLDGLNLSRAWCWRGIADALDDRRSPRRARDAADAPSRRQPAACRRRLYGRALAGDLRAAGAGGRLSVGMVYKRLAAAPRNP